MKRVVTFIATFCFITVLVATLFYIRSQAATTYYSQGSLDPTLTSSWNSNRLGGGTTPANFTSGDTFVIQNSHNMSNTTAWAVSGTGNKIQIENGGTLTAGALVSCTVFQIDNGGTYIVAFADGTNGAAADIPGSPAANKVFGASSTVEIQKWGDGTGLSPAALPSGVSWGNLKINVATLAASWQQGGNVTTINGNLSILATGGATRLFRLSSSQTITVNIGGDVIISGGTLDLSSTTGVVTFNIGGSFNQTGGTFTASGSVADSVNFTGTNKTFTQSAGTLTNTNINWTVNGGASLTLANNLPVATSRTVTVNGTLNCGTNSVSGAGNFTLSSGATLGIGSAAGITSSGATGNIQVTGTRSFSTSANYTYNGSAAQVTGNGLQATVNNLTINNSAGVSLSSSVNVSNTLTLTSGTFTIGANTLTLNNPIAGTPNNLSAGNTSSITIAGTASGINVPSSVSALNNLTVSNSVGSTLQGNLAISNTLTVSAGTFDQGASFDLSAGLISVSSGATLKNFGTGDLFVGAGGVSNTGTINYDGSGAGCGDADSIAISSTDGTQRTWSGTGNFLFSDVDVKDQGGTRVITVFSGTNSGNNGANWVFIGGCTGSGGQTYVWVGPTTDDSWTTPANWQATNSATPGRVPASNDVLIFNGTTTPSPTVSNVSATDETIAALRIINNAFPKFSTNGAHTLTIDAGSGGLGFNVNNLDITGSNPLTIKLASGTLGSVSGTITVSGGGHRLIGSATSAITFQNGSTFTTGTGFTGNAFGTGAAGDGAAGSVVFANNAAYIHNAGSSPFGLSGNASVVTFQTGSFAQFLTATGFDASGRTYADLIIGSSTIPVNASQSGTGSFQFDNLTVNSTGSANSTLSYTVTSGAATITIQGNITSTGTGTGTASDVTLTAGTGGIILNKSGTQTFSGGNGRTITFGSNATVNSGTTLALQRNLLVTPYTNVLSIRGTLSAGSPSPGGYVIGSLLKPVSGDTTFEVGTANGYSPVSLLSPITGSGDFTVSATQTSMPSLDPSKALHRFWTLKNGTPGITGAVLKFTYLAADVVGGGNEANYRIVKYTGTPPATFPEGTTDNVDETSHTATTTVPMTSFSDWSVAEPNSVTVVKLESFSADGFNNGNLVKWQTGFEVDNLGFNVYRMSGGKLSRITPSIVAGSALMAGRTALTAGLSYSWFDPKGLPDSAYYIEDIDLNGTRTMHGPITPVFAGNTESPSREQAMLLSEISNTQADATRFVTGYPALQATAPSEERTTEPETTTAPEETPQTESQPSTPTLKQGVTRKLLVLNKDESQEITSREEGARERIAPVITAQTANERSNMTLDNPLVKQRAIAAGSAVKIAIRKAGWYRATQAELVAAGLDPNANPGLLQLYADGVEQPIQVRSSNEKLLSADAYLEFYGRGMDTLWSDARTYWLVVGSQPGRRINGQQSSKSASSMEGDVSISQSIQEASPKTTTESSTAAYSYTVERKDKIVYFNALLNGEADNFFGPVISKTPAKQDMTLSNIDSSTSGPATLDLALQGVTVQAHKVRVVINGFEVGVVDFNNVEHPIRQFQIPRSYLVEGNNSITLTSLNGDSDINLVDYVRLTYWRTYRADNDQLTFTSSHTTPVMVEGFTSPQIRVFDITNPDAITQVSSKVTQKGAGYTLKVAGGGGSLRTLLALAESQVQHPAAINANESSNLSGADNRADFIILTHRNFRDAVKPLADLRRSQGLETLVVDVEDVYDEFSYGAKSPAAIKDFLGLAQNTWALAPRYVLFVGDASFDPRNYQGFGSQDLVPTRLVDATTLETASDDALADFDGDGIADLSVGRLPVQTAQQAQLVIGKIVNYSPGQTNNSALLVSDHLEGYDFEAASNLLRTLLPQTLSVTMVNRGSNPTAQVKNDIISGINAGPLMVNYAGHGSTDVWTGVSILSSSDAAALANGNRLPLFVSMTCLNGRFQDSNRVSLAEALMKATNGGAVAVWASSGLTEPDAQSQMDQQLMRLLFTVGQSSTLGDAVRGAKHATNDQDVRKTWIFFGDPTMRIR